MREEDYITNIRSMLFDMYRNYEKNDEEGYHKRGASSDGAVSVHYPSYYGEDIHPSIEIYSCVFNFGGSGRRTVFPDAYTAHKYVKAAYLAEMSRDYEAERQERAEAWDNYHAQTSTTVPDL